MNAFKISVTKREDADPDAPATQFDAGMNGFAIVVGRREDVDPDAPATQCDAFGAPPPPVASAQDGDLSLSPLSD